MLNFDPARRYIQKVIQKQPKKRYKNELDVLTIVFDRFPILI